MTQIESDSTPTIQVDDQTLTPTSVDAWKPSNVGLLNSQAEGIILNLPSGNVVRMKRTLDLPVLLKTGQIPNPLAGIVQRMMETGNPLALQEQADNPNTMFQLLDLLNETIIKAVIEPPFDGPDRRKKGETPEEYQERLEGWTPTPGKLSVWDMEMEDKFYVFAVCQGAVADLASFREQQEGALSDLQASQGVPVPSKPTARTRTKK